MEHLFIHTYTHYILINPKPTNSYAAEATPPQRRPLQNMMYTRGIQRPFGAFWAGPWGKIVGYRFITISTNCVYMPGAREFPYDL